MIKNWRFFFSHTFFFFSTLSSITENSALAAPELSLEPSHTPLIVEITPVVILNAAAPTQKQNGGSLSWTGNVASGFGLLTGFSLFDTPFDLEIGGVYLNHSSERDSGGTLLTLNTHHLHLPLLLRFNFDDRVSIGLGGYASIAKGNVSTSIHDRDFGLLFSARASLKIVPQLYFIVDGRYQHGLSNLANIPPGIPGDLLNTRSMQAYLGFSYRFMPF